MVQQNNLQRFIEAQNKDYPAALREIKNGRKQSHWMWYIFPQIKGLGYSDTSKYYAIADINEARAFLDHHILGKRLIEICNELIKLERNDATRIFGSPDDLKFKSCMTLFAALKDTDPVFQLLLNKFFKGEKDNKTLQIITEI